MGLTRVFQPIRIRGIDVPNRIVRAAHGTALGSPPTLLGGEDWLAYHVARARGGVGLTILEAATVHPSSGGLGVLDDAAIDGYRQLMARVAPYGMRVFQQLAHSGHVYPPPSGIAWGASTIPSTAGTVAQPMTTGQIAELTGAYAAAARRCQKGGLDGVELHIGHGYLMHEFLSPVYNTRTDDYGGPLENRMRIVQELLRAIRAAVGDEPAIGVRAGASQMPTGVTESDLRTVIVTLQQDGLIDFVDCTAGDYFRLSTVNEGMDVGPGYELPSVSQITSAAAVPTIVNGRFRTLQEAEQVIADGVADLVSMVRAHIADPEIVRKTREGRTREIRPCVACNQGCNAGLARMPPRIGCAVNASAGHEATLSEELIERTSDPLRVLVVGGGPAGLEAARVAALGGHQVTLVESSGTLGGALDAARRGPRTALLGEIVDWLGSEVRRLSVTVELGVTVLADDVIAREADAVILATGSRPRLDGLQPARPFEPAQGVALPHVLSSQTLLQSGARDDARTALVLDTVGHFEAITAAEALIARGLEVTFLTSLPSFGGPLVQATQRDISALEFLYTGNFKVLTRHHLVEIREDTCVVRSLQGTRPSEVLADIVVLVTPNEPNREIYESLRGEDVGTVRLIGDAAAPRDMQTAIAEGHSAGRSLPTLRPRGHHLPNA
jgi:2,4-dienoyl-CoA reductase-like NADH-dependent reductase (Old Yellow Enzyme family)/thioredoxin reductase